MTNTQEMLDVKELKRKRLEELKVLCKNLGLKYSGNKPVLIGRLIEFYTSGSIEGANKRSVDDLYAVFQDYLGTKRQKSSHITELERDKTKSKHYYAVKGERLDFRRYMELVFGVPEVVQSVNFIGESLKAEYDTQTREQFISGLIGCQQKLLAAAFNAHRYFNDDLIPSIHFPLLVILVVRETDISDLGIESLLYECPKLRVLDIALTHIRGDGLCDISTKCPLLESIEIYHPLDLAIAMPHLTKCSLIHTFAGVECYDFDDEIISMLVSMPNLVNCRVTYSHFDKPTKITAQGVTMLRRKLGFERIDFPAEQLLDSISDPLTESGTTTQVNESTPPSIEFVAVKASPPSSPQQFVAASDMMPEFLVRKSILAPKEIRVFDPVGYVSSALFHRALRLIPALTALDLCTPTCRVEKIDSAILLLAELPCASRITRLGLAQQSELTDKAILALRSFTALRELNLSFCMTLHQYSQLYPQHLLLPAPSIGWGTAPALSLSSSLPPLQLPSSPSHTSPAYPPSSQSTLHQVLLQQINQAKSSPAPSSLPSSLPAPSLPPPSPPPSPPPPSPTPSSPLLTTQQILQQRLQQRIQQRSDQQIQNNSPQSNLNIPQVNSPQINTSQTQSSSLNQHPEHTEHTVPDSLSNTTPSLVPSVGERESENLVVAEMNLQEPNIQVPTPASANQPTSLIPTTPVPPPSTSIPNIFSTCIFSHPPVLPITSTPSTPSTPSPAPLPPPALPQPLISSGAILAASTGWPNLETLYLDGIPFAPRTLNKILSNCPNVRIVSLNACGLALDNLLNGVTTNPEFHEFQRTGLRILHTKKK